MEINDSAPKIRSHPRRPRVEEPGSMRIFTSEPITVR
jgi:hypothetical protein